jgi:predicted nucleic acid-binding protein
LISVDTNVLLYSFDFDAPAKRMRAKELINGVVAGGGSPIALQVLAEFHAVSRRKKIDLQDTLSFVGYLRDFCDIIALNEEAFDAAVRALIEHQLPVWDAMLWATLDQSGCRTLLTEDFQDGRTLGGVTFLNPFNPANDAAIARLMRPRR